jgi:hypothetical protein
MNPLSSVLIVAGVVLDIISVAILFIFKIPVQPAPGALPIPILLASIPGGVLIILGILTIRK